mmetsp:Transcript_78581/g.218191  ORF Transcript_78581/g.218191 Transcript_78581/m.218191 type:complete len:80 (+) Transcript_78581:924-1163(+)
MTWPVIGEIGGTSQVWGVIQNSATTVRLAKDFAMTAMLFSFTFGYLVSRIYQLKKRTLRRSQDIGLLVGQSRSSIPYPT